MTPEIVQLGNTVLHQGAKEVDELGSEEAKQLVDSLKEAVDTAGGVGIAAPQIAVNKRVFVISSKPNARYPRAPTMLQKEMINPVLLSHNSIKEKGWEGCLSVPNMRGLVPRYTEITVSYYDLSGKYHQTVLTDFIARIFQHELDHLDGLTFIDRVESVKDLISEKEWFKQYPQ